MDDIQQKRHQFEVDYWIKEGYVTAEKQDDLKKRLLQHRKPAAVENLIKDMNAKIRGQV